MTACTSPQPLPHTPRIPTRQPLPPTRARPLPQSMRRGSKRRPPTTAQGDGRYGTHCKRRKSGPRGARWRGHMTGRSTPPPPPRRPPGPEHPRPPRTFGSQGRTLQFPPATPLTPNVADQRRVRWSTGPNQTTRPRRLLQRLVRRALLASAIAGKAHETPIHRTHTAHAPGDEVPFGKPTATSGCSQSGHD